jgi:hypothetical protein
MILLWLIWHLEGLLPLDYPNSLLECPFRQPLLIHKMLHQPPIIRLTQPEYDFNLLFNLRNPIIHIFQGARTDNLLLQPSGGQEERIDYTDLITCGAPRQNISQLPSYVPFTVRISDSDSDNKHGENGLTFSDLDFPVQNDAALQRDMR